MEITKEQKERILALDSNFFKEELEVGKWYKLDGFEKFMFYYDGKYSDDENYLFGFNLKGEWSNSLGFHIGDKVTPATNQEVGNALIIEAKKRGYAKGNFIYFTSGVVSNDNNNNEFWNKNGCVFRKGKWAEILETITKAEAEKLLNKIII